MAFFPNDRPSASFLQLIVITKQHQNKCTITEPYGQQLPVLISLRTLSPTEF
jgi:hypothetical protein